MNVELAFDHTNLSIRFAEPLIDIGIVNKTANTLLVPLHCNNLYHFRIIHFISKHSKFDEKHILLCCFKTLIKRNMLLVAK